MLRICGVIHRAAGQGLDSRDKALQSCGMNFTAYIDEAGDEGISKLRDKQNGVANGQSRWLILGGILVSDETDKGLPKLRDDIVALFQNKKSRDLHFRELKHEQKVAAVDAVAEARLGVSCVCSCKSTLLDGGKFEALYQQKGHLYNYLTRFLLERLTTAVARQGAKLDVAAKLKVVFSRRMNTDYHAMREYLTLLRDGKEKIQPVRSIDWSVFSPDDIRVENHSKWAGLQIADVATSAMFNALEPNFYGKYEPRYALTLAKRMLSANKSVHNCGLTLIPRLDKCPLDKDQRAFVDDLQRKWQAPGP